MGILLIYHREQESTVPEVVRLTCEQDQFIIKNVTSKYTLLLTESLQVSQAVIAVLKTAELDYAWFDKKVPSTKTIRVCAMDMDSTVINIECIDEIARFAGCEAQVKAITEATMRGEIPSFKQSVQQRVALLAGVPLTALGTIYQEVLQFNPGAKSLVQGLRSMGIPSVLLSGGFTFFTDKVREDVGFEVAYSNVLEVAEGRLTGKIVGPIMDAEGKQEALMQFAQKHQAQTEQSIAVGDGANDLKMLGASDFGVAYRAKPIVQAQAAYQLNYSPLDALLIWFDAGQWLHKNGFA